MRAAAPPEEPAANGRVPQERLATTATLSKPGAETARAGEAVPRSAPRLKGLDVLRGLAILLVLGRHRFLLHTWMMVGWSGVILFFVLSGFLVSSLLFKEFGRTGRIQVGRFLVRRGFKIYPAFWVFALGTVVYRLRHGEAFSREQLLAEFAFFQNYVPGVWGHTWSLAVEEHFYLLLGLGFLLASRRPGKNPFTWVPGFAVAVCAGSLLIKVAMTRATAPFDYYVYTFPTHLNLTGFALGLSLAYLNQFSPEELRHTVRKRWPGLAIAALALLLPCLFVSNEDHSLRSLALFGVPFGFALVLALTLFAPPLPLGPAGRWLSTALTPVAWVGFYSYSIYLWHLPVDHWGVVKVNLLLGRHLGPTAGFWVYCLASILVGVGTSLLIEQPFLYLRDRICPSGAKPGTVTTAKADSRSPA